MTFSSGMTLNQNQLKSGGFGALMDDVVKLSKSFKKLKIDHVEMALLAAVCLISGGTWDPSVNLSLPNPTRPVTQFGQNTPF